MPSYKAMKREKNAFLNKIDAFIGCHHLMDSRKTYLIALSGGADSVAALLALLQLGYRLHAVHCNFHLRGDESDRDQRFCEQLCEEHGVALSIAHFATREYAESHHVSIEMAARSLRYGYFEQLRQDLGAEDIVVAHHQDDAAETVLLNLIRGTGVRGLTGIVPRRGHVIRPLLGVGRDEIEIFLGSCGQEFVTDSTNLEDDAVRNKIRHHVLPAMRAINPSVTDSILMTASRLHEAMAVFDEAVRKKVEEAMVPMGHSQRKAYSLEKIHDEHTLFYILHPLGFSPDQIDDLYAHLRSLRQGAMMASSTHELLIDRGSLLVQPLTRQRREMRLPIEGKYVIDENCTLRISTRERDSLFVPVKDPAKVSLDADTVSFPLTLRTVRPGDRFIPFGMRGSKLVSDFLTDLKINLFDKRDQCVLTDSTGRILWVLGHRIDHRCRVTSSTRKILDVVVG